MFPGTDSDARAPSARGSWMASPAVSRWLSIDASSSDEAEVDEVAVEQLLQVVLILDPPVGDPLDAAASKTTSSTAASGRQPDRA